MFKPESEHGSNSTKLLLRKIKDHSSDDYNLLKKKPFKKEYVKNAQK